MCYGIEHQILSILYHFRMQITKFNTCKIAIVILYDLWHKTAAFGIERVVVTLHAYGRRQVIESLYRFICLSVCQHKKSPDLVIQVSRLHVDKRINTSQHSYLTDFTSKHLTTTTAMSATNCAFCRPHLLAITSHTMCQLASSTAHTLQVHAQVH